MDTTSTLELVFSEVDFRTLGFGTLDSLGVNLSSVITSAAGFFLTTDSDSVARSFDPYVFHFLLDFVSIH